MTGKTLFRRLQPILFLTLLIPGGSAAALTETGLASWYGGKFQGRQTASGEIYDTAKLTAAHKTLTFGTLVRVVNLDNQKEITVRINDRGPFVEGRIIDLSQAAAMALEMVGSGIARVKIEVLSGPESPGLEHRIVPGEGTVIIQIGSYGSRGNAAAVSGKLKGAGMDAELEEAAGGLTRVILKNVPAEETREYLAKLAKIGFPSPLVRRSR